MGIFDKAKDEAENLAQQNPGLADKAVDQLGQAANQATGDRFENQIDNGIQAAQDLIAQRGQGTHGDQGQGGGGDREQGGGGDRGQEQSGQGYGKGQYGQDQGQGQGGYSG